MPNPRPIKYDEDSGGDEIMKASVLCWDGYVWNDLNLILGKAESQTAFVLKCNNSGECI